MSNKLTGQAKRTLERLNGAADQPWRCTKCNTAIVPGRRMPCKCPGFDKQTMKEIA